MFSNITDSILCTLKGGRGHLQVHEVEIMENIQKIVLSLRVDKNES